MFEDLDEVEPLVLLLIVRRHGMEERSFSTQFHSVLRSNMSSVGDRSISTKNTLMFTPRLKDLEHSL